MRGGANDKNGCQNKDNNLLKWGEMKVPLSFAQIGVFFLIIQPQPTSSPMFVPFTGYSQRLFTTGGTAMSPPPN